MSNPIPVTRPSLPDLEELIPCLEEIWASRQLTNGGPFHDKLEAALCDYLGVPFVSLFNNGTQALITGLQALDLEGEVITTPFSFVATSHALVWNRLTPVFADIETGGFNLDPAAVEAAITPNTCAILAVHCYGFPCQTKALQLIAERHGIKLIYDAAHAFGVEDENGSILNHGDLSVLSFHATKVFNTLEGGAVICRDANMKARLDRLKNFGIAGEIQVEEVGSNGKMNEVQAALGLLQLKHMDKHIRRRQEIDAAYQKAFSCVQGLTLTQGSAKHHNYAYFPLCITAKYALSRDDLFDHLRQHGIMARRYFHPLIPDFSIYRTMSSIRHTNLPNACNASDRVLCLPIHDTLSAEDQNHIIELIVDAGSNH
jgi:dTDP-4-amino-4,6-dideoxygalactose transaminase